MYTNKQIWSVSYPILLSLLAQNVINVTDTAFLGHVSEVALGASAMGGLFYICIDQEEENGRGFRQYRSDGSSLDS
ncbi:hypothetical protein AAH134_24530, partial [Bacteroides thetaiotaomicron]